MQSTCGNDLHIVLVMCTSADAEIVQSTCGNIDLHMVLVMCTNADEEKGLF